MQSLSFKKDIALLRICIVSSILVIGSFLVFSFGSICKAQPEQEAAKGIFWGNYPSASK